MASSPRRRYIAKIRKLPNGCWVWTGLVEGGQPVFKVLGKRTQVRRWAWPDEEVPRYIATTCDEPLCVRPEHLTGVRAGPKPPTPEAPDEIVQFLIDNPRGHLEACRRFNLSVEELCEIYYEWERTQPIPLALETAPRRGGREESEEDLYNRGLLQLFNSTEKLW